MLKTDSQSSSSRNREGGSTIYRWDTERENCWPGRLEVYFVHANFANFCFILKRALKLSVQDNYLSIYVSGVSVIFEHLYTLQSHHKWLYYPRYSYHLSPYSWLPSPTLPTRQPLTCLGNHQSSLCIYEFAFYFVLFYLWVCFAFEFHIGVKSYSPCLSLCDLFHWP